MLDARYGVPIRRLMGGGADPASSIQYPVSGRAGGHSEFLIPNSEFPNRFTDGIAPQFPGWMDGNSEFRIPNSEIQNRVTL